VDLQRELYFNSNLWTVAIGEYFKRTINRATINKVSTQRTTLLCDVRYAIMDEFWWDLLIHRYVAYVTEQLMSVRMRANGNFSDANREGLHSVSIVTICRTLYVVSWRICQCVYKFSVCITSLVFSSFYIDCKRRSHPWLPSSSIYTQWFPAKRHLESLIFLGSKINVRRNAEADCDVMKEG